MSHMYQQREEIQFQEYVRLQETFNTIIRSLERIERLDSATRINSVSRKFEADRIHSEYSSMREALITQCFCLQIGITKGKFQGEKVRSSLLNQVNRWMASIQGAPSEKVKDALSIVRQAINGVLKFDGYRMGGLPENHSQAVEGLIRAREDLDKMSRRAAMNPIEYFRSNQYPLEIGQNFLNQKEGNQTGNNSMHLNSDPYAGVQGVDRVNSDTRYNSEKVNQKNVHGNFNEIDQSWINKKRLPKNLSRDEYFRILKKILEQELIRINNQIREVYYSWNANSEIKNLELSKEKQVIENELQSFGLYDSEINTRHCK